MSFWYWFALVAGLTVVAVIFVLMVRSIRRAARARLALEEFDRRNPRVPDHHQPIPVDPSHFNDTYNIRRPTGTNAAVSQMRKGAYVSGAHRPKANVLYATQTREYETNTSPVQASESDNLLTGIMAAEVAESLIDSTPASDSTSYDSPADTSCDTSSSFDGGQGGDSGGAGAGGDW